MSHHSFFQHLWPLSCPLQICDLVQCNFFIPLQIFDYSVESGEPYHHGHVSCSSQPAVPTSWLAVPVCQPPDPCAPVCCKVPPPAAALDSACFTFPASLGGSVNIYLQGFPSQCLSPVTAVWPPPYTEGPLWTAGSSLPDSIHHIPVGSAPPACSLSPRPIPLPIRAASCGFCEPLWSLLPAGSLLGQF